MSLVETFHVVRDRSRAGQPRWRCVQELCDFQNARPQKLKNAPSRKGTEEMPDAVHLN